MSDNDSQCPPEELLLATLGALLFASGETVHPQEIRQAFKDLAPSRVDDAIEELEQALARSNCGLRLEKVAGGFRIATASEVGAWVRHFFRQRNRTRLTPAALETLAIVAYRQPVTAPEIQAIRAKDPTAALKSLVDKKMLRILGKKKVVGNPLLYGTSKHFLVHFGLDSLDELPALEDFDEFVDAVGAGQVPLFSQPPAGDEVEFSADLEAVESGPGRGDDGAPQ